MSIEYLVGLDCAPKQALTVGRLVELVKSRRQAETLLEHVRAAGDQRDPSQIEIEAVRTEPGGSRSRKLTLADLLAAGESLAPHARHCDGCPANVHELPFGCYGTISYPITVETEKWLLSLLPNDLDSTAGAFLTRAIADFEYDGAPLARLRAAGGTFFEQPETAGARWGQVVVTVDQLLHMMFFVGALGAVHCKMLGLFFGVLPHDSEPAVLARKGAELAHATLPDGPDAPQVGMFLGFFDAFMRAASLDVELMIDA